MSVGQELRGEEDARSGWHGSEASVVARELGVDPEQGLTVEEARRRLGSHGPNRLAGAKRSRASRRSCASTGTSRTVMILTDDNSPRS